MAIATYPFSPQGIASLANNTFTKDWPVVYILEGKNELYVGQTTRAQSRFKEHYKNPDRLKLSNAHIITDEEYNLSANFDIESSLIQYLAADNKYILQNGNTGLSNHSYFDREKYQAKFEIIWKELQIMGLAHQDLFQIRNSDLFKYSPYKALTDEQMNIVLDIERFLAKGIETTHIVSGEPGTGKSVLATYLAKYLAESRKTENLKIGLVVPQAGLRKSIKKVFSKVQGLKSNMVLGPSDVVGDMYDVLIVDEAHRLRRRVNLSAYGPFDAANKYYDLGNAGTQLDWITRASKSQVLLYDSNQSVVPGDIRPDNITTLSSINYVLSSQLRVLAGNDYIMFIDDLLSMRVKKSPDFGSYDLRYFKSVSEMIKEIKRKDKEYGLARVVAGYAWAWKSKEKNSQDYDIELDGLKLKWNSTNIDWVNSKNAIDEIGCIHTVQGYDLNFVAVIIGPEVSYDPGTNRLVIDKKKYMDINGKRSIESPEELDKYIVNIYKTLLTRGIRGTYIHACDPNLEKYLTSRLV